VTREKWIAKVEAIIAAIGLKSKITVMASLKRGRFRKPSTGPSTNTIYIVSRKIKMTKFRNVGFPMPQSKRRTSSATIS
jgi:hypothetical protein